MFMLAMIPTLLRSGYRQHKRGTLYNTLRSNLSRNKGYRPLAGTGEESESQAFIHKSPTTDHDADGKTKNLGIIATARLSIAFCFLWFLANYFAMACLQYTTVASTTILTSTSSFWTLLIGAVTGVERFTWRKFFGVMGSFIGIILISSVDFSTSPESSDPPSDSANANVLALFRRAIDTFPDKTPGELALGDGLALFSAVIYGVYSIALKKMTIKALPRQLNMPLFFGLVGTFNIFLLSPLFPILHYTGIEPFQPPPSAHIWMVLLVNSVSSLLSDICWAYAMVLTSPLVVTVGLSLTIPLSLVGEMVLQGRYEGWVYWVGASIVVGSFLFVDHEEREDENHEVMHTSRTDSLTAADGTIHQSALSGQPPLSSSQDSFIEEESLAQQDAAEVHAGRSSTAERPGHLRRRSSGVMDVLSPQAGPARGVSVISSSGQVDTQVEPDLLGNIDGHG